MTDQLDTLVNKYKKSDNLAEKQGYIKEIFSILKKEKIWNESENIALDSILKDLSHPMQTIFMDVRATIINSLKNIRNEKGLLTFLNFITPELFERYEIQIRAVYDNIPREFQGKIVQNLRYIESRDFSQSNPEQVKKLYEFYNELNDKYIDKKNTPNGPILLTIGSALVVGWYLAKKIFGKKNQGDVQ
jgi:hypothetical protein